MGPSVPPQQLSSIEEALSEVDSTDLQHNLHQPSSSSLNFLSSPPKEMALIAGKDVHGVNPTPPQLARYVYKAASPPLSPSNINYFSPSQAEHHQPRTLLSLPPELLKMIAEYTFAETHLRVEVASESQTYRVRIHNSCGLFRTYCAAFPGYRFGHEHDHPVLPYLHIAVKLGMGTNDFLKLMTISFQNMKIAGRWISHVSDSQKHCLREVCFPSDYIHDDSLSTSLTGLTAVHFFNAQERRMKRFKAKQFREGLEAGKYPSWSNVVAKDWMKYHGHDLYGVLG